MTLSLITVITLQSTVITNEQPIKINNLLISLSQRKATACQPFSMTHSNRKKGGEETLAPAGGPLLIIMAGRWLIAMSVHLYSENVASETKGRPMHSLLGATGSFWAFMEVDDGATKTTPFLAQWGGLLWQLCQSSPVMEKAISFCTRQALTRPHPEMTGGPGSPSMRWKRTRNPNSTMEPYHLPLKKKKGSLIAEIQITYSQKKSTKSPESVSCFDTEVISFSQPPKVQLLLYKYCLLKGLLILQLICETRTFDVVKNLLWTHSQ